MDGFLTELLAVLAELLGELLLQLLAEGIADVASRVLGERFEAARAKNIIASSVPYAAAGFVVGIVSVAVFPHPLVRPARIHGISLIVSPLLTGLIMSQVGSLLRRRNRRVVQIDSFGCGFAFAFGMALARFLLVRL